MASLSDTTLERTTLGAGCFWGVEATFQLTPGVVKTLVGYAAGETENPTYEAVCTGETGHAEVVDLWFDPEKISYNSILEVFFKAHDPTTLNRQGPDVGTQYRSIILTYSAKQEGIANQLIEQLTEAEVFDSPIVTQVTPCETVYPAEEYHQQYFEKKGLLGKVSCH